MDFLDSLDLDTKDKKSHRVRSWYLYEQYKSLEKHQLDAAQKLKDRSYQDRILRQELSERRARRKLYDQFGLCQSESRIQKKVKKNAAPTSTLSVSNDEFFESFSEQEDEHERVTQETDFEDDCTRDLSPCKSFMDDFKTTEEPKDNVSYSESVNSVVENFIPTNNECNEYDAYVKNSQMMTVIIAQDINKQLDTLKENIQSLENITKLEDDKSSDNASECLVTDCQLTKSILKDNKQQKEYNMIIPIWSRLVSFAYQIVQQNHGNCYCDYSSQFLTAVLACDVLRRGVNRMCNILQHYVSPISFATDDEKFDTCYEYVKTKKSAQSRKSRKTFEYRPSRRIKRYVNSSKYAHRNYSDNCRYSWYRRSSLENSPKYTNSRRASEPWRSVAKNSFQEASSSSNSSIWPQTCKENMSKEMFNGCSYCKKAVNPMLKIARYIDSILKGINDN